MGTFQKLLFAAVLLWPGVTAAQKASLVATPQTIQVAQGALGSTDITWNAPSLSWVNVMVSENGAQAVGWTGGGSTGGGTFPYVQAGHSYTFKLYRALPPDGTPDLSQLFASVTVIGVPETLASIAATPQVVEVPAGSLGTTSITWNVPSLSWTNVMVSVDGAAAVGWSGGGSTGTQSFPFVQAGRRYTFSLYKALPPDGRPDLSRLYASTTVTGVPQATNVSCNVTLSPGALTGGSTAAFGSGATICLSDGTYTVSQTIELSTNQTLRGLHNQSSVTLRAASGGVSTILLMAPGSSVKSLTIEGVIAPTANGLPSTVYAALGYSVSAISLQDVTLKKALIPLGVNAVNGAAMSRVTISDVGSSLNAIVEPCAWITDSQNVSVEDSTCYSSPLPNPSTNEEGDGGIAFYNVNGMSFLRNTIFNSGVYLVNTHDGLVQGNSFVQSTGWGGLDVVSGSSNLQIVENSMVGARFGAAVVADTVNVQFLRNTMTNNNTTGLSACSGINVLYRQKNGNHAVNSNTGLIVSDNIANPGPESCQFMP